MVQAEETQSPLLLDWRETVGLSSTFLELDRVLSSGRLHPVILLHGPDGVGKRTVALRLAAKFLCQTNSACGECGSCREVLAGLHPDLLVIDDPDESVIKTAVLEELQRNLDILSPEGVRVAIITDCDRMTREAANRMLKTLEEPPEQVRLILTTSRPRALLPTLLGRCLQWRVSVPSEEELIPWLKNELDMRGRSPESDATYRQWLKRHGYCPGLILKELDDSDDRIAMLGSRFRALVAAPSASEVIRLAEELVRTSKASVAEILAAGEWELNQTYQGEGDSTPDSAVVRQRRRRSIQTLRQISVNGKVHLNAQIGAESIGLSKFPSKT